MEIIKLKGKVKVFSIDKSRDRLVCFIPSRRRLFFVVAYIFWIFIVFLAIIISLVLLATTKVWVEFAMGVIVVLVFTYSLFLLLNRIIFWLNGFETVVITKYAIKFYRKGLIYYHHVQIPIGNLRVIDRHREEGGFVSDIVAFESEGAMIDIEYFTKRSDIWGRNNRKIEFGASLKEQEVDHFLEIVLSYLKELPNG